MSEVTALDFMNLLRRVEKLERESEILHKYAEIQSKQVHNVNPVELLAKLLNEEGDLNIFGHTHSRQFNISNGIKDD